MEDPVTDWRARWGEPRPRTLPELMLTVLDAAAEDAADVENEWPGRSARHEVALAAGHDLYDALRELLEAMPKADEQLPASGIGALIDWAGRVELGRRENAVRLALHHGVGLRIDVYGYDTRYSLDPNVPAGEIHEHVHDDGDMAGA